MFYISVFMIHILAYNKTKLVIL